MHTIDITELTRIFKALGDETRIRIMKLLLERKNLCVCEVIQALDISQTRASRNLGILEQTGFVTSKRKGSWVHYSISKNNLCCRAVEILLKKWLNKDKQIIKDRKKLNKAKKMGGS